MTQNDNHRVEVGSAKVAFFLDEGGVDEDPIPLVMFPEDDYADVGDFVADRIESSGIISRVDTPDKGDKTDIGTVWWDKDGKPTRLEGDEFSVQFDRSGSPSFDH
ncbi:hypothetical protein [Halomontanus rarus]|uniref:hypothetical protein n=1 Tax=Halomontanus rarus TaxID=3034020 RepID=UPI0023E78BD0|nr:hypothetical protein [Halovivax sp. TS33]